MPWQDTAPLSASPLPSARHWPVSFSIDLKEEEITAQHLGLGLLEELVEDKPTTKAYQALPRKHPRARKLGL